MVDLIWQKVNNNEEVLIHCPTIESATDFIKECSKRKMHWLDVSFCGFEEVQKKFVLENEEDICWNEYKDETVYSLSSMGLAYQRLDQYVDRTNNFFEWSV